MTSAQPTTGRDGSPADRTAGSPAPGKDRQSGAFASLTHPLFRILFASSGMMYFALQGAMAARGWLARESNAGLGGVMFGFGLAMVTMGPVGGILADRLPKRLTMAISYAILAVSSLWLGVAISADALEYWMLVGASAMQGLAFAVMAPARMAYTAEAVPRNLLPNAIALGQLNLNLMKIVGPMIAGWIIAIDDTDGPGWLYYAATVLTIVAALLLLLLPATQRDPDRPPARPFADLAEGVRYVARHRELRIVVPTSLIVVMVGFPFVTFLPRVSTELLDGGAAEFGYLVSAQGLGAFAAAYLVARRITVDNGWPMQAGAGLAFGGSLMIVGLAPNLLAALIVVGLLGATNAGFQIANNTLALTLAEPEYHGRVQSFLLLSFGAFGLAALPLGLFADTFGLPATFVVMGGVVCATILLGLTQRAKR